MSKAEVSKTKMSKTKKIIGISISVFLALILIIATILMSIFLPINNRQTKLIDTLGVQEYSKDVGGDKIHFLNVGSGDAILLESNGRFALIDSGEDTDNPRNFSNLAISGFEQDVLAYLKAYATGADGKVHLDFVLGTHAHSDHIGGFDTIIADEKVVIDKAYLKKYNPDIIREYEKKNWDNQEVYDQMVGALKAKNVHIVSEIDTTPFMFGNFELTVYNGLPETKLSNLGENDNSMAILVKKGNQKIFLTGDMDNLSGDERRIGKEVGEVDLLKLGHHGYPHSNTAGYLMTIKPKFSIVTNSYSNVMPGVKSTLTNSLKAPLLDTVGNDGIVVKVEDDSMSFYKNSMKVVR